MPSQYPWAPGLNAQGQHVINSPVIVNGILQVQQGKWSFPKVLAAPGTVASGGTVVNNTGYDAYVYAAAATGISAVKVLEYNGASTAAVTFPGSLAPGATGTYFVPGPGAIAVSYAGSLGWAWQGA